ncbi:MAG TPA: hypothetical protein VFZ34_15625 [Blastocatellia bacterium]|nr:hypothetical protein [Blastocatellia bacterium]
MCAPACRTFTRFSFPRLSSLLLLLCLCVLVSFGYGAPKKQDLTPQELTRRLQRLALEKQKIARLPEGDTYTLVFLGIRSGEEKAESTLTAQVIPEFAGEFGIGELTTENYSLLPNENGIRDALGGRFDELQVKLALELVTAAAEQELRFQVITHSNGIQGAREFFARLGAAFRVATALIIAPNSREWSDLATIVSQSDTATLITSNKDNRLNRPRVAHRRMELWRGNLKYGYGFNHIAYFQTFQKGHGAQHYLSEYRLGRYKRYL